MLCKNIWTNAQATMTHLSEGFGFSCDNNKTRGQEKKESDQQKTRGQADPSLHQHQPFGFFPSFQAVKLSSLTLRLKVRVICLNYFQVECSITLDTM